MNTAPYHSNSAVYTRIQSRLSALRPPVKLGDHIEHGTQKLDSKIKIGPTVNDGVTFSPRSFMAFRMAIANAKNSNGLAAFHYDDRNNWIFKLGAIATNGFGYREIGSPSLHCAISNNLCNIHLDDFGFVALGSDGQPYYTLNCLAHIADELVYRAYIREFFRTKLLNMFGDQVTLPIIEMMDRSYLALPTLSKLNMSKLTKKVDLRVGGGFKLAESDTFKLRFESTCGNRNCSDNKHMVTLDIDLDKLVKKLSK